MKLTPLDIRHREFRKGLRGYSEEEVDVFLDDVADEFERVFQDNMELRDRIQLLEDQVAGYEGMKDTLSKTLVSAQQQADETRANAHKEGELILRDAELKARNIVGEVYSEKQKVQQNLIQLRQIEEDFRFKFRSLLEAHINLLTEDDLSEERRRFKGLVTDVEQQLTDVAPGADLAGSAVPPAAPGVAAAPVIVDAAASTPAESTIAAVVESSAPDAPAAAPGEPDLSGYLDRLPADDAAPETIDSDEPADETKGSSVRRFLFGKRDAAESEESGERQDRDFEW